MRVLTEQQGPVGSAVAIGGAGLSEKPDGFGPTDLPVEQRCRNNQLRTVEEPPRYRTSAASDDGLNLVAVGKVGALPEAQVLLVPAQTNGPLLFSFPKLLATPPRCPARWRRGVGMTRTCAHDSCLRK